MSIEPWILIAEDNDEDFLLIVRAVQKIDSPVLLQRGVTGEHALEVLSAAKSEPILALLDLKMPRMSGLEMLQCLRSDPKTRHLPAVMLTSSDQPSDVIEAYRLGCNAYLRKPIDYLEFVKCVQAAVNFWLRVTVAAEV